MGTQLPPPKSGTAPNFRQMFIVAIRSPISVTAVVKSHLINGQDRGTVDLRSVASFASRCKHRSHTLAFNRTETIKSKTLFKAVTYEYHITKPTRRPASADRTARRQFQATGKTVSRTQASDAMTSRLPRYKAKCVQRRCFQCGSVPLRSDIKGTELPLPIY